MKRTILDVSVEDVEKRRVPSKHYVYVIYVTWSDATVSVIYRRYSRFFELQSCLLDRFPDEGGSENPRDRVIPFLPGKILFGRSHIEKVARRRLQPINQYCKSLIRQPDYISECDLVLQFFEATQDDLLPNTQRISKKVKGEKISDPLLLEQYVAIADYDKEARNEVSLTAGQNVEVVEKTETGWWFVHTEEDQGWAPSSYLERQDGSLDSRLVRQSLPGHEEYYMCIEAYSPEFDDEISLERGAMVEVLERNLDGWWLVRSNGKEGRAPATNLTRAATLLRERLQGRQAGSAVERVPNLMSISNIHLQNFERSDPARATICTPATHKMTKQRSLDSDDGPFRRTSSERTMTRPKLTIQLPQRRVPHAGDLVSSPLEEVPGEDEFDYQRCPPPRRDSVVEQDEVPKKVKMRPPRPAPPKVQPKYFALADFEDQAGDGISLKEGQELQILQKTSTGWWYVKVGTQEGWAPASYIDEKTVPIQRATKSCHQLSTISSVPVKSRSSGSTSQKSPLNGCSAPVAGSSNVKTGPGRGNIMSELACKLAHSAGASKGGMKKSKSDNTSIQKQAEVAVPVPVSASKNLTRKTLPPTPLEPPRSKVKESVPLKPRAVSPIKPMSEESEESNSPDDVREYFNVDDAVRVSSQFYTAKEAYDAVDESEISLDKGEEVEVTTKNESGWWYVKTDYKEGWAPSGYLIPKVSHVPLSRSSSTKSDRASLGPPPPPPRQKPNIAEMKASAMIPPKGESEKPHTNENAKPQIPCKKPSLPSKPKTNSDSVPVVPSSGRKRSDTVPISTGKKVNNAGVPPKVKTGLKKPAAGRNFGQKKPAVGNKPGIHSAGKSDDKQGVQALAKMFDR